MEPGFGPNGSYLPSGTDYVAQLKNNVAVTLTL
jgi:hypothetical protein